MRSYPGVLILTLAAALAAACLSSAGLANWADALPDSAASRGASTAAHRLDTAMTRLHINAPAARLHDAVRALEGGRFGPEQ